MVLIVGATAMHIVSSMMREDFLPGHHKKKKLLESPLFINDFSAVNIIISHGKKYRSWY